MEVFIMYKSKMDEVIEAINRLQPRYYIVEKKETFPSESRQWDRIIGKVCTGCGAALGRYEHENRFAFCLECRTILFPETVNRDETHRKRYSRFE
jgi:hypothetical protein